MFGSLSRILRSGYWQLRRATASSDCCVELLNYGEMKYIAFSESRAGGAEEHGPYCTYVEGYDLIRPGVDWFPTFVVSAQLFHAHV